METRKLSDDRPSKDTQPVSPFGTSPDLAAQLKQTTYDGTLLKERYLIEGELGRGGIGVVYLARDMQLLQRRVVIKVLLQDSENSAHTPWFKKKFEQEIEALVRLDHPGIIGVLDAGAMPDGKLFFVMQYVAGETMRSLLKVDCLDFARIASIVRQIGAALSAAHEKGVIHRDLKPENVMVQTLTGGEPLIKLIDFGIATVKDSQFSTAAERTKVAGALPYMAPEQLRGQPEPASDTWALGVIAYELVTGRLPFIADTMVQLHELQRQGLQNKPSKFRPDLPQAAEVVIQKALLFDPRKRIARAKDLGDELARALSQATTPSGQLKPGEQTTSLTPEMAHVLFMDIVGYSKLPMDQQPKLQRELREIVRGAKEYQRANEQSEMISLPTGDGMALVFFRDPVAPVQCAVEIARALKEHPEIELRMGVHSGPVYRVADINTSRNVAGGGINLAQRVMDCGDADHILVSHTVAETIRDIGDWSHWLHDLGQQEVKHGAQVHIYNLYKDDIGNPKRPTKTQIEAAHAAVSNAPTKIGSTGELPIESTPAPKTSNANFVMLIAATAVVLLVAIAFGLWLERRHNSTDDRNAGRQEQQATQPSQPPAAPSRTLNYSFKVRAKGRGNKTSELAGEVIFTSGDQLCIIFNSPQDGYLYIINEGPNKKNGLPQYNYLFPDPRLISAGVPTIKANQQLFAPSEKPPWFPVDTEEGAERLWLVYADRPVPLLEDMKKWLNDKSIGEIQLANDIQSLQQYLSQNYAAAPPKRDVGDSNTTLTGGKDGALIYPIKVEHR
jgi:serine/threonine protein kinase